MNIFDSACMSIGLETAALASNLPNYVEHRISIDGSARWIYQEEMAGKKEWDFDSEFATLACPWPEAWFEYRDIRIDHRARIGVHVKVEKVDEEETEDVVLGERLVKFCCIPEYAQQELIEERAETRRRILNEYQVTDIGCCWLIRFDLFARVTTGTWRYLGTIGSYLDRYGKVMGTTLVTLHRSLGINEGWVPDNIVSISIPVMFAISLLNCKNVYLEDIKPSRQYQRLAKRTKKPIATYKELVVEPMKKIVKSETAPGEGGIKKALHICRGHFKDYRDGKGLFGRFNDLYWWDMHVRGSKQYGEVKKTYKVVTD